MNDSFHIMHILVIFCYWKNIGYGCFKVLNKQNFRQRDTEMELQWGSEFTHRGDTASCYPIFATPGIWKPHIYANEQQLVQ